MLAGALLILALAAFVYFFKGNFGGLRGLTRRPDSITRRRVYRRRIAKLVVLFAGPAILALPALGRFDAATDLPAEFYQLAAWAGNPSPGEAPGGLLRDLFAGLAGGTLIGAVWTLLRRRRGKGPAMFGDFSTLLPRDGAEAWLAAGGSIAAGVTEELYFRLLIPLLVAIVSGSAALGFAVSIAMFGFAHRYQKWQGVVASTLTGAMLSFIYLLSGQLWLAMVVHVLIDLNGLVLRPALAGMLRARGD